MTIYSDLIQRVQEGPGELLDVGCPYGIANFISGFGVTDSKILLLWRSVDSLLLDPRYNLGIPNRACFETQSRDEAFLLLIKHLKTAAENGEFEFQPYSEVDGFIEVISDAIREGRMGMYIYPDNSYTALFQFWSGYITSVSYFSDDLFFREKSKMAKFEKFLQARNQTESRWFVQLRVFYNGDLVEFLKNWEDCFNER